jgi:hypothetical protein
MAVLEAVVVAMEEVVMVVVVAVVMVVVAAVMVVTGAVTLVAVVIVMPLLEDLEEMTPSLQATLLLPVVTTLLLATLVVTVASVETQLETMVLRQVPPEAMSSPVAPLVPTLKASRMTTSWTTSSRMMSLTNTPTRGSSLHLLLHVRSDKPWINVR